jgi:uncharacterized membrane protein
MAGFAAAFIVVCYIAMWTRPNPVLWAASSLVTVLGYGACAFGRAPEAISDAHWMLAAGGLAVLHLIAILPGRGRASADPQFNIALGLYAIAAAALAAFAAAMVYEGLWLTLAWSLLVPITAIVAVVMPLRLLGAIASVVAAVVALRLFAARELWFYANGLWLGPHFVLYAYGGPAAVFWTSSWTLSRTGHRNAAIALEGVALGLGIALISLELRILIGGGLRVGDPGLLEASAHAVAWLGATVGLLHRLKQGPSLVPLWGSRILLLAASAILLAGCLYTLNPLLTGKPLEGGPFFNTLILGYLLPAIMIAFISQRLDRIGWGSLKPLFGAFALLLALAYLTLETKRYFQGAVLTAPALSDAENYAYSAVWLAFAVALLIAGIWRKQPYWRYAGLIVAALVIVKVFALDMAGLPGLYRIASATGLGLCLLGIGYLYAHFLQPSQAAATQ